MKFSLVFYNSLVLASGIWAAPSHSQSERRRAQIEALLSERSTALLPKSLNEIASTSPALDIQPANPDSAADTTSINWSGAVLASPPNSQTFTNVSAQWTIPNATVPASSNSSRTFYALEWVGIDGYSTAVSILQAGTLSAVSSSSTLVTAWYEWYPGPLLTFTFGVTPGDVIVVSVVATNSTAGTANFDNLTTGESTSIALSAPSASSALSGVNAEWILENNAAPYQQVADFVSVDFTDCTAGTSGGELLGLTGATLVDMVINGTTYATPTIISSSELNIVYD